MLRQKGAAYVAAATGGLAVLLPFVVALAGPSAAVASLGDRTWYPAWDLGLGWSSATVTVLLAAAYLLGTACVASGLVAVRGGLVLDARRVAVVGAVVALALTLVPATGSADHLSYLAYGRIAAAGGDPYLQDPLAWHGGTDPVAGAVAPPWQHTPSVYGPVATLLQAGTTVLGAGDLRLSAWIWQLLCGAAFLATGYVLDRVVRDDPAARTRAVLLWTLNPLLLGQLVLGGHLDVIGVAFGITGVVLAARKPLSAGLFLGAAIGSKVTLGLFVLAALWGVRRAEGRLRSVALGVVGAAVVLVPSYWLIGRHAFDQLHRASQLVSLSTPWRLLVDRLPAGAEHDLRSVLGSLALGLGAALVVLLARRGRDLDARDRGLVAAVLLGMAWLLTTPYALPWYDAVAWAPLAVIGAGALDLALLARLAVMSLAYVPGLVTGMSPSVQRVTLAFRSDWAPWINLAVLLLVIGWAAWPARRPRPAPPRPPAGAHAH